MIAFLRRPARLLAALLLPLGLAACETTLPSGRLPEMTFDHLAPIPMAVSAVEVVDRYEALLETAAFFAKADYGVLGDLHEVVPALTEAIRKEKR